MKDLTGKKFGRLLVLSMAERIKGNVHIAWNCICDCGVIKSVFGSNLKRGLTKSCGCIHREELVKRNTTHNLSNESLYGTWHQMIERCYNTKNVNFHNYGGRGIVVCERWLNSVENFINDMGIRPEGYSLDRIEVNGNYEPNNCKWSSVKEQLNNKRDNRLINFNGETLNVTQWSEKLNINPKTIDSRLRRGKSLDRVLSLKKHNFKQV